MAVGRPEPRALKLDELAPRVAAAVAGGSRAHREQLLGQLSHLPAQGDLGPYEQGVCDALLAVVSAASSQRARLAPQARGMEAGSLAARLLLEIAAGVTGANSDLAERLATDATQLSRAGRRLRELGLARRVREGRLNRWEVTASGRSVADSLRQ